MFDRHSMTLCSGTRTFEGAVPIIETCKRDGKRNELTGYIHPDGYSWVGCTSGNHYCHRDDFKTIKVSDALGPREVICDTASSAFHAQGPLQDARGVYFQALKKGVAIDSPKNKKNVENFRKNRKTFSLE
jgi:hypothetical protein